MVVTTPAQMQEIHRELTEKAAKLMKAKSHDYANESDSLKNFRKYGSFGVVVRLEDKLSRLDSFEEHNTLQVTDETIEDTLLDIINYAIIYGAMKREQRQAQTA